MTGMEYISKVLRTEAPINTDIVQRLSDVQTARLLHAVLGLAGEYEELAYAQGSANRKKELGDVAWYAALCIDACYMSTNYNADWMFNSEPNTMASANDLMQIMFCRISCMVDNIKKHIYYGKTLSLANMVSDVAVVLMRIRQLCSYWQFEFNDMLETNIRKLQVRYPEKFTEDAAVNRDIAKEESV